MCVCVCVCVCVCRKTQRSPSVIGRRQTATGKKGATEERARGWYPFPQQVCSLLLLHLSLFISDLEAAFNSCNAIDVIAFYLKMEHKRRCGGWCVLCVCYFDGKKHQLTSATPSGWLPSGHAHLCTRKRKQWMILGQRTQFSASPSCQGT